MKRFTRPWKPTRRDTDVVALEGMPTNSTGPDIDYGKEDMKTSARGDSDGNSQEVKAAEADLRKFSVLHEFDPNLPEEKRNAIEGALDHHDKDAELNLEHELEENSPYPEVAAVVRTTDSDDPANTVRAWILGMIFVTIGSGCNMLFSLRNPAIQITSIVAQLVSYPVGLAMAAWLPKRKFSFFGIKWTFNPGPFNMKEHTLVTIMANVSFAQGAAYSTYSLESLRGFYGVDYGVGFAILFTVTTQMVGLGLAGMFRRFLVYPAAMIWPNVLPNVALFYSLFDKSQPDKSQTNGWSISRYRWFVYVFIGSFVWYWFPGFIWQGLSVFAFATWIRPNNVIVNQLFGGYTGLSFIPITFDWTYITAYVLSPLIPPWHAIANTMIGLVVFIWIATPAIHYSGAWYSKWLQISSSGSYDNTGARYNVSRILTPEYTLDPVKYAEYSPLFLSTTFAINYGLSFASIISVIVHTYLYHGKAIWYQLKSSRKQEDDVHMKMMKKYPEAPDWWFAAILVIMIALSFFTVLYWPTHLTWWALIIAFIISFVWMVPLGIVQAVTNIQIGLNVFTEFLVGYMLPGRPLAMMSFKTYGYIAMYQGLTYTQDLKLGHYMKVPPRSLFWAQGVASLWGCLVQVAVLYWAFGNINDICQPDQSARFSCPNGSVFFTASIIWGVIGPSRMFSGTGIYTNLQYFWLIGAGLPIIFYFLTKRFPRGPWRYLHAPVIFGGIGYIPPSTPLNYLTWGITGFIFNKLIRNSKRGWWSTYNYITSAALDAGLAIATIVIFFALLLPQISPPDWWGNRIIGVTGTSGGTLDAQGAAVQAVVTPPDYFGPRTWT